MRSVTSVGPRRQGEVDVVRSCLTFVAQLAAHVASRQCRLRDHTVSVEHSDGTRIRVVPSWVAQSDVPRYGVGRTGRRIPDVKGAARAARTRSSADLSARTGGPSWGLPGRDPLK